jgi:hypothetical protein
MPETRGVRWPVTSRVPSPQARNRPDAGSCTGDRAQQHGPSQPRPETPSELSMQARIHASSCQSAPHAVGLDRCRRLLVSDHLVPRALAPTILREHPAGQPYILESTSHCPRHPESLEYWPIISSSITSNVALCRALSTYSLNIVISSAPACYHRHSVRAGPVPPRSVTAGCTWQCALHARERPS